MPVDVRRLLRWDAPPFLPESKHRIWTVWESTNGAPVPDVVAFAQQSWRVMHPRAEIIVVNSTSPYFPWDVFRQLAVPIGMAGMSDLIRVHVLGKYGGTWMDATNVAHRPMPHFHKLPAPVMVVENEPKNFDRQISSWLLVAQEARLPLMLAWERQMIK